MFGYGNHSPCGSRAAELGEDKKGEDKKGSQKLALSLLERPGQGQGAIVVCGIVQL